MELLEQSPPETGQRSGSWLTLALSGEAAVASAKSVGNTIGEHQGEPGSGLVRFNASLDARCGLAGAQEGYDSVDDGGERLAVQTPDLADEQLAACGEQLARTSVAG